MNSVLVLYIVLGNNITAPNITREMPDIGLFFIYNVITQRNEWVLSYSTDKIQGKDANKIRAAQGFLTLDGIGTIKECADFKLGGGMVLQYRTNFKLNNTYGLKEKLDELKVEINGRQIYVIEYTWDGSTDADIGSREIDVNPLFAGRIDAPCWGETIVEFMAAPTFEAQRRANVSIDGLPVTFGTSVYAYYRRIFNPIYVTLGDITGNNSTEILYRATKSWLMGGGLGYRVFLGEHLPPFTIQDILDRLRNKHNWYGPQHRLGWYVFTNESDIGVRIYGLRVDVVTEWPQGDAVIPTPVTYLELDMHRDYDFEFAPDSIHIVIPEIHFLADGWATVSGHRSQDLNIFEADANGLAKIACYGEITDYHGARKHSDLSCMAIEIQPHEINDTSLDTIASYVPVPAKSIRLLTESQKGIAHIDGRPTQLYNINNLESWDTGLSQRVMYMEQGIYGTPYFITTDNGYINTGVRPEYSDVINTMNAKNPNDIDISTKGEFSFKILNHPTSPLSSNIWMVGIVISLPDLPEQYVNYSNAYLHIKMKFSRSSGGTAEHNIFKVFARGRNTRPNTEQSWGSQVYYNHIANINVDVDNHLSTANGEYDLKNWRLEFLGAKPVHIQHTLRNRGYRNFKIDGIDFRESGRKEILMLATGEAAWSKAFNIEIYEIGVVFEGLVNISEKINARSDGRLFGEQLNSISDTVWNQRKRAGNHISNPIDAIEHLARLSNWNETKKADAEVNLNWGKCYAPTGYSELIDTAGFDSKALNEHRNIAISGQVIDEDNAINYNIIKSLCTDFYIGSKNILPRYYSNNGHTNKAWIGEITMPHESVFSLDVPENMALLPTVGIKNLLGTIEVTEPSFNDIYCEPTLLYGYVDGIGYTQEMAVTNVNMPVWKPEYTRGLSTIKRSGFNISDSEKIWQTCKDILNKYQAFGNLPSELMEQSWIGDGGEDFGDFSVSYENALEKLKKILRWMQKSRTSICVGWETGRKWGVGTHVKVSVPHIMGGAPFLCVVESIAKTHHGNNPNVLCRLIILDYDIQNIIKVGNLEWAAKNLDVVIDGSWDYGNNSANRDKCGRLYTWDAAMEAAALTGNGWRLPTRDDWDDLIFAIGGREVAGEKLKSTSGWNDNYNGTNDFGFSALPGGFRTPTGIFRYAGEMGSWWAASEADEGNAYSQVIGTARVVEELIFDKTSGFSVRLVRDR